MATVTLRGIHKSYGNTRVLEGVDIEIADGEYLVLVGPSGCGKSTLLRCIAGLEEITGGDLLIEGRRVNDLRPRDRNVAMVFQSYALYPHMTVRDNMGFALRVAKEPREVIDRTVGEAAAMLGLQDLLDRYPAQLSGGQRQRVAMGRAIVRRPQAFLFDEPLSNLDAALRSQMRLELKRLHRRLQATVIHVTHDQVEALTLADRILVLHRGVVQQVGTPRELFNTPANTFVATFIGSPSMNLFPAEGR
ncbi:MAG: ATP-binding cassette domain-containing protein, partial [Deltaproteobacteria bacterium]|nr:ATP-binding cassette domain-containing protein [Deltaproteobacteria bacterium]